MWLMDTILASAILERTREELTNIQWLLLREATLLLWPILKWRKI